MAEPDFKTGFVYDTVVKLIPQEGRDYRLDNEITADKQARLIVTPLTPLGRAWVPFLVEEVKKPLHDSGVATLVGGNVAAEVATINSIRQKIENEAMAALKARIKAAENNLKVKQQEAENARKEQVAKEGEGSRPNKAVVDANNATGAAFRAQFRANRIAEKVPEIRKAVDKLAADAARADAKQGRVWDVDMTSPLNTLFDRQDVTRKFQNKEELIRQIAEHEFAIEEIRNAAVSVAKQYIIQKEG